MEKLSQKEMKMVAEVCGDSYIKQLNSILEKQNSDEVSIVNTGMVSSGKSSLYNALINSPEEYFPTGAARTTTKAIYYKDHNISYIDTPGIDVREEDDELALKTILKSDIILMVHNIRTGPLNKSEVEWIEQLVTQMNNARIIFVASWKDTREKEDDYLSFIAELKKQVCEIIGEEVPFFEVSVKKFQTGVEKSKEKLIENSGVLELKKYVENMASEYAVKKKKIDQKEYEELLKEIREILKMEYADRIKKKKKIIEKTEKDQMPRKKAWEQIYECFVIHRTRLSDLKKELKNIQE